MRRPYNASWAIACEQARLAQARREDAARARAVVYACPFCGREVPDGTEPVQFACCGEVGHAEPVTEEGEQ
jgi:hypothetical protein